MGKKRAETSEKGLLKADIAKMDYALTQSGRYKKSNFLISAKYGATLMENKLLALSLYTLQKEGQKDKSGNLISQNDASEIKELLGCTSGSFYTNLKFLALKLIGRQLLFEDKEKHTFHYMNLVQNATYKNRILTVTYNSNMDYLLTQVKENFSILTLETMLGFKHEASFRLYEILKSKAYYPRNYKGERTNVFKSKYNISELKFTLGLVDIELVENRGAKELLNKMTEEGEVDYDAVIDCLGKPVYTSWYDFKKRVLDVATEEINESTDMEISFRAIKEKGLKITHVEFTTIVKELGSSMDEEEVEELSQEKKEEVLEAMDELFETPLRLKDYKAIAEASNYDLDKIRYAYEVMTESKDVEDKTAFMISAIKGEYQKPTKKKRENTKRNSFNNFTARDNDYDQLEYALLMANEKENV